MSALTIFYQECPVCGRSLRVNVKYFGREMSCSHCEGTFIAGKDQMERPHQVAQTACPTTDFLTVPVPAGSQLG